MLPSNRRPYLGQHSPYYPYSRNPRASKAQEEGGGGVVIGVSLLSLVGLGVAGYFIYKQMDAKAKAEIEALKKEAAAKRKEAAAKKAAAQAAAQAAAVAESTGDAAAAAKLQQQAAELSQQQEVLEKAATTASTQASSKESGSYQGGLTTAQLKSVQTALNNLGYASPLLTVDGKWGPKSGAALKSYQKTAGLPDTGVIDQATFDKLTSAGAVEAQVDIIPLSAASKTAVQKGLNTLGFAQPPLTVDGKWGDKTREAIRTFQKAAGLPVSGMYTKATNAAFNAAVQAGYVVPVEGGSKQTTKGAGVGQSYTGTLQGINAIAKLYPYDDSEVGLALTKDGKMYIPFDGKSYAKNYADGTTAFEVTGMKNTATGGYTIRVDKIGSSATFTIDTPSVPTPAGLTVFTPSGASQPKGISLTDATVAKWSSASAPPVMFTAVVTEEGWLTSTGAKLSLAFESAVKAT